MKSSDSWNTRKRCFPLLLCLLLIASMVMINSVFATPNVYVKDPADGDSDFIFTSSAVYVGYKFNATLWISGYGTPPVFAWQVTLKYNQTLLSATKAWNAFGDPAYIFTGKSSVNPTPSLSVGSVLVGDTLLGGKGETPPPDPAKLATIEFEVMLAPPSGKASCGLNIDNANTFLLDDLLSDITPITKTNGYYQYSTRALELKGVKTWYWASDTEIRSIARGDVDGDAAAEIVTGGYYYDGTRIVAQLCIWNGATLALENVKTWYWTGFTYIWSVAVSDVDGDGVVEIVTGGNYNDGTRYVAQLCVWNGATLTVENVKTWYWTDNTEIDSVAVGDVDGDAAAEIVTGGYYYDGTRIVAQLCVWNGATLALENVKTWYWTSNTEIDSVAVGDVDGDAQKEIVTGGYYWDGDRDVAQLCVWDGASLALENVKTWYWTDTTVIYSVAVGDVDGDAAAEIVTGGCYYDGALYVDVAQLCVWNGATLALEHVTIWYWTSSTEIDSVAVGDVDGDAQKEIVTGGIYYDGSRNVAQLCIWNGATLVLENVESWYWTSYTFIYSVAVGDVDSDAAAEIVTGGFYNDGTPRSVAQLCVWM